MRSAVDAVAVGVETVIVDDPLLTAREIYRERPLVRVVFDRTLRTPTRARLFSTIAAGPVIILAGSAYAAATPARVAALEAAGATVIAPPQDGLAAALRTLPPLGIQSLILEGGSAIHAAAWDAGVVDYVQLYVAPVPLGAEGLPLLEGRPFSSAALVDSRIDVLGPDVLIEGYVHRPH